MKTIITLFFMMGSLSAQAHDSYLNSWGLELGFTNSSSVLEDAGSIAIISPSFAHYANHGMRAVLEASNQAFLDSTVEDVQSVSLSLDFSNKLYHDIVSSYARVGIGSIDFTKKVYADNGLIIMPLTFGISFFYNEVSNVFLDYRSYISAFDEDEAGAGYEESMLLPTILRFGWRTHF